MELLDFWNGGANVLLWCRKFWVSKIIQGLKFLGPKSAICGLEFWGKRDYFDYEINFQYVIVFFETGQLMMIWGLWKSWYDSYGA